MVICWWLAIIKSLKNESRHDVDFAVIGGSVICHNLLATCDDNFGVITTQYIIFMSVRHRELTRITDCAIPIACSSLYIPVVRPEYNKNVKLSMSNMICDLRFLWMSSFVKSYIFHKLYTHTIIYGCCFFCLQFNSIHPTDFFMSIFHWWSLLNRNAFSSFYIWLLWLLCYII